MRRDHAVEKMHRDTRLEAGVYGEVHKPVLPTAVVVAHDFPDYLGARQTARYILKTERQGGLDLRCFFTGILCTAPIGADVPKDRDPRRVPWIGTRDHLVPLRRNVLGTPINPGQFASAMVWTSNVANITLGLAPLLVRLKIRQWLQSCPYDPMDTSVSAGVNMRWILIDMLDQFRLRGRYPWSRRPNGGWWDATLSQPFMDRMWSAEHTFLTLDDAGRHTFVQNFRWRF